MTRRPAPPPKPKSPTLTVGQMRRRIERLEKYVTKLEALDPQKARKRAPAILARSGHRQDISVGFWIRDVRLPPLHSGRDPGSEPATGRSYGPCQRRAAGWSAGTAGREGPGNARAFCGEQVARYDAASTGDPYARGRDRRGSITGGENRAIAGGPDGRDASPCQSHVSRKDRGQSACAKKLGWHQLGRGTPSHG
jgi:hypothetical protein